MLNIVMDDLQDKHPIDEAILAKIKSVIAKAIEVESLEEFTCEVSLLFVDNDRIQDINKDQRSKDTPTDVLSFPQYESIKDAEELDEELFLGDIVISVEKAIEQASEFGHSVERELCYLTVHSMFHLFGYDHDTRENTSEMRAMEELVLDSFGIKR
ncbi:MAG: rRNA maturation RNase YbeY [Acidaminobacteraceae bacterium]